jgi:sucrose phosphorylase
MSAWLLVSALAARKITSPLRSPRNRSMFSCRQILLVPGPPVAIHCNRLQYITNTTNLRFHTARLNQSTMKNQVQLIAYADRLGTQGIAGVAALLAGPLRGLFGGIHLLPFFLPIDGADAGFDPIDHTRVDSKIGGWSDVRALAEQVEVMADVIVNHMSIDSPQFRDYSQWGDASRFNGLFLTFDSVFPAGASQSDLQAIYRPRPGTPFTNIECANGAQRVIWTTFTPKQVDINVRNPIGAAYLENILDILSSNGIRSIRLDAVGYAIKQAGTSCFMLPQTFDFIDDFSSAARHRGMETLVEIHSHHSLQKQIATHADWVYDFALPPLVLHAFASATAKYLKEWITIRPTNALTVLDTHDGIGIIDVGSDRSNPIERPGLLPDQELDRIVQFVHRNSDNQSRLATGTSAANLDLYQINCTFYDAMGRDDDRYIMARAIQFFLPGIPQVYYVGFLAGGNDIELLRRTRVGRDINRRFYDEQDITSALGQAVVARLINLIRLRNTHPAFSGQFELRASSDTSLALHWSAGDDEVSLYVDFASNAFNLQYSPVSRGEPLGTINLAAIERITSNDHREN